MEIKKYKVTRKSKGPDNPFHNEINGSIAIPIEFEVGKRGYFVCQVDDIIRWHRIDTSPVVSIDGNAIETENTIYIFEEI